MTPEQSQCSHGYEKTIITEDENVYTGEIYTTTTAEWVSYYEYSTSQTDKCISCGHEHNPGY